MSSKVEKLEKNKVKLEINVSVEDFNGAVDRAFAKNSGKISIPGFRKGKAPRKVIERYYGEEVMYEDAFNIIAPEAYDKAVEENKLEVVSRPEVDIKQIGKGQELIFTVEVFVKPEVELGEYKGIKAEKKVYTVTDSDIDAEIESMRNKNARMVTVEGRELQIGDISKIDFEGFVDGVPFDGGKAENFELTIGSGQFIPGFEEQLIGMKIAETREINVKFPEEYHSKDLAGKDAMFRVTLNSAQAKELPELDDEFAKDVSEFDTLADLKKDLTQKAEIRNAKKSKVELEDELFKAAAKNAAIEIPAPMLDKEIDNIVSEYNWRLQMQGMNLETYLKMMNQDINSFRQQFKETAEERVKIQLTLDKIAEVEKIDSTEAETDAKIAEMAENYNKKPEEFKATLKEDDKKYISEEVKIQKIADFLTENAKIKEVKAEEIEKKAKPVEEKPKAKKAKSEETVEKPKTKKAKAEKTEDNK